MANPRQKKTTTMPEPDFVHPRQVFEKLRATKYFADLIGEPGLDEIDCGIREGRIYLGFPKSGSGTKGTDEPERPFWIGRDENDKSKLIGAVSPVKAEGNDQHMWMRYLHVFVAFAAFVFDPEKDRNYTKDGFAALAKKVGLEVVDGKKDQAYGYYRQLHAFTVSKLPTMPPVPFSIAGTKAAAVRRTFSLPGYHADIGPNAPLTIPVLNPAKTDGDNPVTPEKCVEHARLYDAFILLDTDRADWKAALEAGGYNVLVKKDDEAEEPKTGTDG